MQQLSIYLYARNTAAFGQELTHKLNGGFKWKSSEGMEENVTSVAKWPPHKQKWHLRKKYVVEIMLISPEQTLLYLVYTLFNILL